MAIEGTGPFTPSQEFQERFKKLGFSEPARPLTEKQVSMLEMLAKTQPTPQRFIFLKK